MTNKLARETSPYLLQHADNPVNWYPWGDEAFEKARQEQGELLNKVSILLGSIFKGRLKVRFRTKNAGQLFH